MPISNKQGESSRRWFFARPWTCFQRLFLSLFQTLLHIKVYHGNRRRGYRILSLTAPEGKFLVLTWTGCERRCGCCLVSGVRYILLVVSIHSLTGGNYQISKTKQFVFFLPEAISLPSHHVPRYDYDIPEKTSSFKPFDSGLAHSSIYQSPHSSKNKYQNPLNELHQDHHHSL